MIGPRDAGKTTFCQGILGKSRQDIAGVRQEDLPRHTINTISVYGQEKYLVLEVGNFGFRQHNRREIMIIYPQDIDVHNVTDALMPAEVHCDVCCLVYDVANPRSFEFVARIYLVSSPKFIYPSE